MKRLFALLLVVMLLALPVSAAGAGYVTDDAGLLTAREEEKLESRAQEIAREYDCGVYIITVDAYEGRSVQTYAEQLYTQRSLGMGPDRCGILLLLSMAERDYALITYNLDVEVEKDFLSEFADDQWYDGFAVYLDDCEQALSGQEGLGWIGKLALIILLPCGVAAIVCVVLAGQLRSVRRQTTARTYITGRGLELTHREDFFVNRTVRRQRLPRNNGHHGGHHGGGGRSGGFRGSSGKF